ncbi:MAG: hypothetical protein MJ224_04330 [archaeon]|nr:hypothetical protein [archaeon]
MKWKYKTLMLLTLLIFCIGGVCAADNNTTDINTICSNKTILGLKFILGLIFQW